jgi:hypothetical protein
MSTPKSSINHWGSEKSDSQRVKIDPSIAFSAGRWLLLARALTCRGIPGVGPAGVPEVDPAKEAAGPDVGPEVSEAVGPEVGPGVGAAAGPDVWPEPAVGEPVG